MIIHSLDLSISLFDWKFTYFVDYFSLSISDHRTPLGSQCAIEHWIGSFNIGHVIAKTTIWIAVASASIIETKNIIYSMHSDYVICMYYECVVIVMVWAFKPIHDMFVSWILFSSIFFSCVSHYSNHNVIYQSKPSQSIAKMRISNGTEYAKQTTSWILNAEKQMSEIIFILLQCSVFSVQSSLRLFFPRSFQQSIHLYLNW